MQFFDDLFKGLFGTSLTGQTEQPTQQDPSIWNILATSPQQGREWLMRDYPYQEPHPLDDWVKEAFQNMANEAHEAKAAEIEAGASRFRMATPAPSPSNSQRVVPPDDSFLFEDPDEVEPDTLGLRPSPDAPIPPDDSPLAAAYRQQEARSVYDDSHLPQYRNAQLASNAEAQVRKFYSATDAVRRTYAPGIGANQTLPVGGTMFGKTWADVPRSGGSPESRMWGGPRSGGRHAGVDIPGAPGDPVFAVGGGTVLRAGEGQGYGKMVDVRFPDGTVHRFAHLNSIEPGIRPGAEIKPGTTIGGLGFTGNAGRGFPHLHLEVFKDEASYTKAQGLSSRASWNLRMDPLEYYNRGPMSNKDSGQTGPNHAAVTTSFLNTVRHIESSNDPNKVTGSYKGYFQLSERDFRKYGGQGSIFDPAQNTKAAAAKFADIATQVEKNIGRAPTSDELYLAHQQGVTGLSTHVKNPDAPAWKNMQTAASSSERWAKRAIWGNLTPDAQRAFGSVDRITSRQFLEFWRDRFNTIAGKNGL